MKPVILAIVDGWGWNEQTHGNPIFKASKPTINFFEKNYPSILLQASGIAVGLDWGDFGNSEVGHMNIGAGRTVKQYSSRIKRDIDSGDFENNSILLDFFEKTKNRGGKIHFSGLLTAGNVHAALEHLLTLGQLASKHGFSQCYYHLYTDGKDSGQSESIKLLRKLPFSITTIIGRFFAMDREENFDRTNIAFDLIAKSDGDLISTDGADHALGEQPISHS